MAAIADDNIEHYRKQFAQCKLSGSNLSLINDYRLHELQAFVDAGFPSYKCEPWKYTSVNALKKNAFAIPSLNKLQVTADVLREHSLADCHQVVLVDGFFDAELSDLKLPEGATLISLGAAINSQYQPLMNIINQREQSVQHPFAALNGAFLDQGIVLHLNNNVSLAKPVHIMHIATELGANCHFQPRYYLLLDESSSACVIESYVSDGQYCYFTNSISEAHLSSGAHLSHYKTQQESVAAYHIAGIHAYQAEHSSFNSYSFAFGAKLARNDIIAQLSGVSASASFNGLYMIDGRQHIDNHTLIQHGCSKTSSEQYYKGVLNDRSRAVFNGEILVSEGAQLCNSSQANKNLLLSANCEIDTKPQLQVYNDNVKCSHGVTVGDLDRQALFYLRSRGINKESAESLLIYAFAKELLEHIEQPLLKSKMAAQILSKLPQGTVIEQLGEQI